MLRPTLVRTLLAIDEQTSDGDRTYGRELKRETDYINAEKTVSKTYEDLADLGLIDVEQRGQRVTFAVTEDGRGAAKLLREVQQYVED